MATIKACLIGVLLFIGLVAAYIIVLAGKLQFPINIIVGVLCGVFMAVAIGLLASVWQSRKDLKIIEESGTMPAFRDGKRIAVTGPIYAIDARPLKTPFSEKDCVAYEYKVSRLRGGKSADLVEFFGYRLIPSFIRTPFGEVRLMAWPDLSNYEESDMAMQNRRAAATYLCSTPFRSPRSKRDFNAAFRLTPAVALMKEIFNDADGSLRMDCTREEEHATVTGEPAGTDEVIVRFDPQHQLYFETAPALTFTEKYVPYGETVCLIGTWSAAKQGIVPDGLDKGKMTSLYHGSGYEVMATLRKRILRNLIVSPLIVVAVNWAVWWLLTR